MQEALLLAAGFAVLVVFITVASIAIDWIVTFIQDVIKVIFGDDDA